jgi:starvation-inducible DNA-binding protein
MRVGVRPYCVAAAMGAVVLISPAWRPAAQDAHFHNAPASSSQMKNPYAGQKAATTAGSRLYGVHETPTDLNHEGVAEVTAELRRLLADTFALYLKTRDFHWHMTGQHFRDYHLLLDQHADQIFAMNRRTCAQNGHR